MGEKFVSTWMYVFILVCVCTAVSLYVYSLIKAPAVSAVMCDVGSGDGILIHFTSGFDVLIDTGESRDILECIEEHMNILDQTIEIVIITHPHTDHYKALIDVIDHYKLEKVYLPKEGSDTKTYARLLSTLSAAHIDYSELHIPVKFNLNSDAHLTCMYPTDEDVYKISNPNDVSYVCIFTYGDNSMYLTGDASNVVHSKLIQTYPQLLHAVDIVKVPHHGSIEGLDLDALQFLHPKVCLISVGIDDQYGNPDQELLDMLKMSACDTYVTSEVGTVILNFTLDDFQIETSS